MSVWHSGEFTSPAPIEIRINNELTLRQLTEADSEAYFDLIDRNRAHLSQHGDETATKYPTIESVRARNAEQNPGEYRFGIWTNEGELVGFERLRELSPATMDLGYWLSEEHEGKGIVTMSSGALLEYATTSLGYEEVLAWVESTNEKSQAVLKRLGFEQQPDNSNRVRDFNGQTFVDNLFIYEGSNHKLREFSFDDQTFAVSFVEIIDVAEGVVCDVYDFVEDPERDLAIVRVASGHKTPLQKVLLEGSETIEGYLSGEGVFEVKRADGSVLSTGFAANARPGLHYPVEEGDTMQWQASGRTDLVFFEICKPPYQEGRYENLEE